MNSLPFPFEYKRKRRVQRVRPTGFGPVALLHGTQTDELAYARTARQIEISIAFYFFRAFFAHPSWGSDRSQCSEIS